MPALARHLLRTFDQTILLLVGAISVGLGLASGAGLLGVPLALILISWFFKYAYALLDEVAHGVEQPPVLSMEMVNPLTQRPLAQLAICYAAYAGILWTHGWLRGTLIVFLLVALPASVAILGVSGKFLQALNPLALLTVIRALGRYYIAVMLAVAAASLLVFWIMPTSLWLIAKLAIAQLAVLAVFNLIGAALYEHRDELDLEVMHSPELSAQRAELERLRRRGRMVDEIYTQARVRKYAAIESILTPWLDATNVTELRTDAPHIVTSAIQWNDRQALRVVAAACVARLHSARQTIDALDVFEAALGFDPTFRLGQIQACVELAELAKAAGRRSLTRKIVTACSGDEVRPATVSAQSPLHSPEKSPALSPEESPGVSLDIRNRLTRLRADLER
ncbi:MAG TPA: hypothetical protein VGN07_03110 [Steroidobacteraceae bacterium]|jgi:hypothetical protein